MEWSLVRSGSCRWSMEWGIDYGTHVLIIIVVQEGVLGGLP